MGYSAGTIKYNNLAESEKEAFVATGKEKLGEKADKFAKDYIDFLVKTIDYWDYAIDLDVDEFLGIEKADEFYQQLTDRIDSNKLIRVWHSTRGIETYFRWCEDKTIPYIAIEGADQYNRNINFYAELVDYANQHNTKTHILATTIDRFQKQVNSFTVDSSTFLQGGRNATIVVPGLGSVAMGQKESIEHKNNLTGEIEQIPVKNHYVWMSRHDKKIVEDWINHIGLDFQNIRDDWTWRCVANLFYSDAYTDFPYEGIEEANLSLW